jgi:acetyl/propionyl-CoA carboxylase alpha subunit
VTGLDLVELQIRAARGEELSLPPGGPEMRGHAFEARINAEDPYRGFMPRTGTITSLVLPSDARWESGVEEGSDITPHYDPTLAKLIVHDDDRDTARRRLIAALDGLLIGGIVTNSGLIRWVLEQPLAIDGRITTRYLDEVAPTLVQDSSDAQILASMAWLAARDSAGSSRDTWRRIGRFRLTPHTSSRTVVLEDLDGVVVEIAVDGSSGHYVLADGRALVDVALDGDRLVWTENGVSRDAPASVDPTRRLVAVAVDGNTYSYSVRRRDDHWRTAASSIVMAVNDLRSPFPALVTDVQVAAGDAVAAGQILVVIEAMKMLHTLTAEGAGIVASVCVSAGQQVGSGEVLVTFVEPDTETG